MAKELYLYSGVYDFVAEALISQMDESRAEDIVVRVNSPGGSVFSGWGIIAKMREHEGHVKVKVDGVAASMAAYVVVFAAEVEALDVSRFLLHRADMYVNSPDQQTFLDSVNKDLRAKLTAKIDAAKLKEIKGVTIEQLFDSENRLDLWLTAKEAKAIGLINRIVKLEPAEITAFSDVMKIAASQADTPPPVKEIPKPTEKVIMKSLEELKAAHPDLYAQAVAKGKEEGKTEETNRVRGWEAFRHIDAEAVTAGIKSGKVIDPADIAEFTAKAISPEYLAKIKAASAKPVETGTPPAAEAQKTEDQKTLEALSASAKEIMKKNYSPEAGKNGVVIKSLTV